MDLLATSSDRVEWIVSLLCRRIYDNTELAPSTITSTTASKGAPNDLFLAELRARGINSASKYTEWVAQDLQNDSRGTDRAGDSSALRQLQGSLVSLAALLRMISAQTLFVMHRSRELYSTVGANGTAGAAGCVAGEGIVTSLAARASKSGSSDAKTTKASKSGKAAKAIKARVDEATSTASTASTAAVAAAAAAIATTTTTTTLETSSMPAPLHVPEELMERVIYSAFRFLDRNILNPVSTAASTKTSTSELSATTTDAPDGKRASGKGGRGGGGVRGGGRGAGRGVGRGGKTKLTTGEGYTQRALADICQVVFPAISCLLSAIDTLLQSQAQSERFITHTSELCFAVLKTDPALYPAVEFVYGRSAAVLLSLQKAASSLLRTIFRRFSSHRNTIIVAHMSVLSHVYSARSPCKAYALHHSTTSGAGTDSGRNDASGTGKGDCGGTITLTGGTASQHRHITMAFMALLNCLQSAVDVSECCGMSSLTNTAAAAGGSGDNAATVVKRRSSGLNGTSSAAKNKKSKKQKRSSSGSGSGSGSASASASEEDDPTQLESTGGGGTGSDSAGQLAQAQAECQATRKSLLGCFRCCSIFVAELFKVIITNCIHNHPSFCSRSGSLIGHTFTAHYACYSRTSCCTGGTTC